MLQQEIRKPPFGFPARFCVECHRGFTGRVIEHAHEAGLAAGDRGVTDIRQIHLAVRVACKVMSYDLISKQEHLWS